MRYIILFLTVFLYASNFIIEYPNLKKDYYKNQIINLQMKIITPKESNLSIIPPKESNISIKKQNAFVYDINLTYKNDDDSKELLITAQNDTNETNETNQTQIIDLHSLYNTKEIKNVPHYCKVIAKNLTVKNLLASKYNDKQNILTFTIEAKNANLKDFTLGLKEENLTIITPYQKASYYGIVDNNITKIPFYYFNTEKNTYDKIVLPINIQSNTISTQTDLNPEEKTFFTPINILTLGAIAFFLFLFLVYRYIFLFIIALIISGYLIYTNLPKGSVYLVRGTKIYILPTTNSTPFYTAPIGQKVKVLKRLKHYTKVKINDKIGWVKNEDVIK